VRGLFNDINFNYKVKKTISTPNKMKKYDWLLFDVDNTLLDFSKASKQSLFKSFEDYGMVCTEEIYKKYKVENTKVWIAFENKEIDTDTLKRIRFKGFFDLMGITIDHLNLILYTLIILLL